MIIPKTSKGCKKFALTLVSLGFEIDPIYGIWRKDIGYYVWWFSPCHYHYEHKRPWQLLFFLKQICPRTGAFIQTPKYEATIYEPEDIIKHVSMADEFIDPRIQDGKFMPAKWD